MNYYKISKGRSPWGMMAKVLNYSLEVNKSALLFSRSWRKNSWIHTFLMGISAIWNAKSHPVFDLSFPGSFSLIITIISQYIYIIIIMSRRLRGYPWPSLAISPYHSSPPAGLQDYNPCPHIAAVCKFVLVVPLLHIHEWGSTGVHRLWARPCFSSSVLRVWFVELV